MKLPIEELLGKEIKRVILETFQEFLLSKNNEKTDEDEIVKSECELKKQKITIDNESTLKKKTKESNKRDTETVNISENGTNKKEDKIIKKAESKEKTINKSGAKDTGKPSTPSKSVPSAKSLQIEKLKSYVFKCGVRKVW